MTARDLPPLELVTSPSASALMDELVASVQRLSAEAADSARIAVVAPTALLLDAAQRALLAASGPEGVLIGVELLHYRSLAGRLLELAFLHGLLPPPPRLLSTMEAHAVVRASVAALPAASGLRRLCAERPRFVASLHRTLGELREALVAPAALARVLGRRDDVALLHAAHDRKLAALLADHGATDAAGHALQAAAAAEALASRELLPWRQLVHHGGYELVGSQQALIAALSLALPTLVLAPCGDGPAHETARRGLARWPGPRATRRALPGDGDARTLVDVEALGDESASAEAGTLRLPDGAPLHAFHVRGARAEADLAARLCADAALTRHVPLERIAVVARSLEPYGGSLEAAFAKHGVPVSTTLGSPLTREPWAQAALLLMDALAEDLPRPIVMELLRSPWARLAGEVADPDDAVPDLWDLWTLSARVVRGAAALEHDVLAWHEADLREQARRHERERGALASEPWARARRRRIEALAGIARRLDADRLEWSRCASHGEHATWLREVLDRWLREPEAGSAAWRARQALLGALDDLARLDAIDSTDSASPSIDDARRLLRDALAGASLPLGESDGSGVRVLSAMPARGLPFDEIVIIGLGQGAFPLRPRHDPFLPDDARAALRSSAPALAVKSESRDEERQLLALLLGAARSRIHVTWQRANDDGAAKAPSLFLREIARLTLGRPDLDALTARAARGDAAELESRLPLTAIPGHPVLAARALRVAFDRTPFADAVLEAAERPGRGRTLAALARRTGRLGEGLAQGLRVAALLDRFDVAADAEQRAAQLAHDGLLGEGAVALPESVSATSLQSLGRCALQWLFERELGIPQREDEADDLAVSAGDLGSCVHSVLESLQLLAIERGGEPRHLASADALRLLARRWEEEVAALAGSRRQRVPLAWESLSQVWLATLQRFVEADAARLTSAGARIVAAECDLHARVDVSHAGAVIALPLRGRVDRIIETPAGWQVEDFKTRPDVKGNVDKASVLKGAQLQGIVYELLLRAWARDRMHPRAGHGDQCEARAAFVPVHPLAPSFEPQLLKLADLEASWSETLAVLEALPRAGAFAFKKGSCAWCSFRAACRRNHPPTIARVALVDEWRDYLDLSGKSTKAQTLAAVRARAGATPDDPS